MQNRIVEVASDGVHLSLLRGFVKLSRESEEIGRIGLPDIAAIIVRGHGASISLNLAARLAAENIPVVLCGANQLPGSVIWPVDGHFEQGRIMAGQAEWTRPTRKRLWQQLIKAKITAQAQALDAQGEVANDLLRLARSVKSGDPDNLEAQAARRYWPRMMGKVEEKFSRDRNASGLNGWLNYGYAVLRAGAARSILAAGLHPSLAIQHESRGEALRLSSDIMEPFRPWVDLTVCRLATEEADAIPELDAPRKAGIVKVLSLDLETSFGASPIQTCLDRLCQSLAQICLGRKDGKLELPAGLARQQEVA